MNNFLKQCDLSVRKVFLIDGVGALTTAILLGLVLPYFDNVFTMPRITLMYLSALACLFAFYSFMCARFANHKKRVLLKIIMSANLLYCVLTICLLAINFSYLTLYDFTYFTTEILIIFVLLYVELFVLRFIKN